MATAAAMMAGGSLLGGALGWLGQERTNAANAAQAREQMDFQREMAQWQREYEERMSNTAHQREVADLAKAGLNPMLSVRPGGSGASTPSVSVPSGSQAVMGNSLASALQGMTSAMSVVRTMAEAWKLSEETKTVKAMREPSVNLARGEAWLAERRAMTERDLLSAREALTWAQTSHALGSAGQARAASRREQAEALLAELEIPRARNLAGAQNSWVFRNVLPYAGPVLELLKDLGIFMGTGKYLLSPGNQGTTSVTTGPRGVSRTVTRPNR